MTSEHAVLLVGPGFAGAEASFVHETGRGGVVGAVVRGDAAAAFDLLLGVGARGGPHPVLVVIELAAAGEGLAELKRLKEHPDLRCVPVIVVTPSDVEPETVREIYLSHANCCVPADRGASSPPAALSGLLDFWFDVARLPPPGCRG